MYELILQGLKTKYEGVSQKLLERMAKKLAKTVTKEEDVKPAVDGVTIQQLIDNEGDRRANEAAETSVKNYETKHKLKDGKPIATTDEDDDDNDDDDNDDEGTTKKGKGKGKQSRMEKMLQKMLENQQSLTDELNALKGERTGATRRSKLDALLAEADEKVRNRYTRDFDRLNKTFQTDDEFNEWLTELTPDIEADIKEAKASGSVTTPPKAGKATRKEGEVDPAVTSYLDASAKAQETSVFSSISGLPVGTPPAAS